MKSKFPILGIKCYKNVHNASFIHVTENAYYSQSILGSWNADALRIHTVNVISLEKIRSSRTWYKCQIQTRK